MKLAIQTSIKAMIWAFLRFLYRVRTFNGSNIPKTGAAVLVPNHVTYLDAMIIAAHVGRPIRFAMYWKLFHAMRWIVEPLGAFPIASREENEIIYRLAFLEMEMTLLRGDLLCIFPEGKLTTTGEMDTFRPGVLKLLEKQPVPIIPIGLRGLWGSYFSRKKKGVFKLPEHWMAEIGMVAGDPLPATTPLPVIETRVRELAHGDFYG